MNNVINMRIADMKAREIAREIEQASDATALVILNTLQALHSATFMKRVYAALSV